MGFSNEEIIQQLERKYEFRNNSGYPVGVGSSRRLAYLGLQHILGICPRRHCGAASGDCHNSGLIGAIVTGLTSCKDGRVAPPVNFLNHVFIMKPGKQMMLKGIVMALFLISLGLFSGCRTAHGFGEDMERAGEKIQSGTE